MNTFTLSPTSQQLELKPGESYTGSLFIVNPSGAESDLHYSASITPYGVVGELYDADLATRTDHTQITDWITIDEPSGIVQPNGVKELKYTINVPLDAPAGGQYATVAVRNAEETKSDSGFSVNNIFEITSIIYADIAGTTIKEGKILDNSVPSIVLTPPVTVTATFENTGNVHQVATIDIRVTNFFTGDVIYPRENIDNPTFSEVIMPDTTRLAARNISDLPALGVFHISQTVAYSSDTSTVEKTIILCPLWFLILAIFTITIIILALKASLARRRARLSV